MSGETRSSRVATNSLERALLVLEMLGGKPAGLSNAEISRGMDIATSSCSYILSRLERAQYVTRDVRTGRYKIGLKILSLANHALRTLRVRHAAEPAMHRLAAATNLCACMTVLDRDRMIVVEKVTTPESLLPDFEIGWQVPVHATASGKVLGMSLTPEQFDTILEQQGLPRFSPRTIISRARLLEELAAVRKQGYAMSDEEQASGIRAVAAPVQGADGSVIAAIGAAGAASHPIWNDPRKAIELVKAAARDVSRCAP